jgi:hypothetical protein
VTSTHTNFNEAEHRRDTIGRFSEKEYSAPAGSLTLEPAMVEYPNGDRCWFVGNSIHREDGPAFIGGDGTQIWFRRDEKHREDGPAVEKADGTVEWWLNDEKLSEAEHRARMQPNHSPEEVVSTTKVIVVNEGKANERTEVVKPLHVRGERTLVAFIQGAGVATKWVQSNRIKDAT